MVTTSLSSHGACNCPTLRGGDGGGDRTSGAGKNKQRAKTKEKPPPKADKSQTQNGKLKYGSKADSDDSLRSDSDEEIDAEALMRKYGLTPDDGTLWTAFVLTIASSLC